VLREYLAITCQELGLRSAARKLRMPYRRPDPIREIPATTSSATAGTPTVIEAPAIVETGSERQLQFSGDALQSRMRIDDPDTLVATYTRQMMSFLLFDPDPEHVLMVGLGGGSMAKFCYRYLPSARITVVEIDERVIAMRDAFLVPPDDHRFRVVHDDGAHYVARCERPVSAVLIDAFDQNGVAPSLATATFFDAVSRLLAPKGVMIMNLHGQPQRYADHLQCAKAVFGTRALLAQVTGDTNNLLYALAPGAAPPSAKHLWLRARHMQSKMPLNFRHYLKLIREGRPL
jgi:spermidine synthase